MNIIEKFKSDGYLVSEKVLSNIEINELRSDLDKEFEILGNPKQINLYDVKNSQTIKKILSIYNSDVIKNLLNNLTINYGNKITFIPQFLIQRNYHVDRLRSPSSGWHRDCGGELKYDFCRKSLQDSKYFFSKMGIYLQENTKFGGCIDLIPKSHLFIKNNNQVVRKKIENSKILLIKYLQKLFNKIYAAIPERNIMKFISAKKLYPKPGSIVVFDSRTLHRGTPVEDNVRKETSFKNGQNWATVPESFTKYSLYCDLGNKIGFDSYMHDRNQREKNINEKLLLNKNLEFLKVNSKYLYEEIYNNFYNVLKKYN